MHICDDKLKAKINKVVKKKLFKTELKEIWTLQKIGTIPVHLVPPYERTCG